MLAAEPRGEAMLARLEAFRHDVMLSKLRAPAMTATSRHNALVKRAVARTAAHSVNYLVWTRRSGHYVCE